MPEILGPEWFPKTPDERQALFEQHVVGTRHTNWSLLANATRSSLANATRCAADLLNLWKGVLDRDQSDAETWIVLNINYGNVVIGPLLGTILSAALAIESMIRLFAEIALENEERDIEVELSPIDQMPFHDRVEHVVKLFCGTGLDEETSAQLTALINFRNDCAHDSPLRFLETGHLERRKFGKARVHKPEERYAGMFPVLYDDPMPLAPSHAVRAARIHDRIMNHALAKADAGMISDLEAVPTRLRFPVTELGAVRLEDIRRIAEAWDTQLLPWREQIPAAEMEEQYRQLARRAVIRSVPDEET